MTVLIVAMRTVYNPRSDLCMYQAHFLLINEVEDRSITPLDFETQPYHMQMCRLISTHPTVRTEAQ